MKQKAKCIIVNRVSSEEQKDGYSLDAQSRKGNEYASERCFNIIKEFTFQESASKSKETRLFDEIMAYIYNFTAKHREALNVVVEKKDRWGRLHSRKEQIQNLVLEGKVILHYYRESQILDKNCSPEDIFMDDVVTSMNKYQSMNIGREARKGMRERTAQGWLATNAPFGYKNNPNRADSEKIIIDETERDLVFRIFELRAIEGLSYALIVDRIRQEGLVPQNKLGTFRKSKIEKILKNRFYGGELKFGDEIFQGKHELIVPPHIFKAVQESFEKPGRGRPRQNDALFSNLLNCGDCGCKVTYHQKKKPSGKVYHLYVCANGKGEHKSLKGRYKHEHEIMDELGKSLDDISITEDFAKEISDALNRNDKKLKEKLKREETSYKLALKALEDDEDQLLESLHSNLIQREMFERNMKRIRDKREKFTDLLLEVQNQATNTYLTTAKQILELAANAKKLWLSRNDRERAEFLRKLLWNPKITGSTIEYHLKKPFEVVAKMRGNDKWGA